MVGQNWMMEIQELKLRLVHSRGSTHFCVVFLLSPLPLLSPPPSSPPAFVPSPLLPSLPSYLLPFLPFFFHLLVRLHKPRSLIRDPYKYLRLCTCTLVFEITVQPGPPPKGGV